MAAAVSNQVHAEQGPNQRAGDGDARGREICPVFELCRCRRQGKGKMQSTSEWENDPIHRKRTIRKSSWPGGEDSGTP